MRERYVVEKVYERDRDKPGVKHKKMWSIIDKKHPLDDISIAIWKKRFIRRRLPERYETESEALKECERLNKEAHNDHTHA